MKKILIAGLALLMLVGCSGNNGKFNEKKVVSREDFMTYVADPNHKDAPGRSIKTGGFLGDKISIDDTGSFYQLILDAKNKDQSIVVHIPNDNAFQPTPDKRLVIVSGVINGIFKAETYSGKVSEILAIEVDNIEVTDFMNAFAPALKTLETELTMDQNGFKISIPKIEFSDSETRVYVKYDNMTDATISSYTFDLELILGSDKYTENSNYLADYPEAESKIAPKTSTEGIVVFDPIDFENVSSFTLMIDEPYAEDSKIEFTDYIFQITMK